MFYKKRLAEAVLPETIKLLREVQKLDAEIDAIGREEQADIAEIDGIKKEVETLTAALGNAKAEFAAFDEGKKRIEDGFRVNRERIDKDKKRLNEIKNDKQYKAVTKEVSDADKAIKLLEMEKTALDEKVASKTKEISDKEAEIKQKEEAVAALLKELEDNRAKWNAIITEKKTKRSSVAASIKPQELKRYELVKSKRAGIGIVPVKKEACQGCYIQIPPQLFLQLIKGGTEELITCPHCHRILYYETEEQAAATTA